MANEIPFEKALERLEKIVQELEAGNISLEEALKKYEEGVKLSGVCQEKLAQAEKRIEILTRAQDGTLKRKNFVPEETQDAQEPAGTGRKKTSRAPAKSQNDNSDDEELLF